MDCYYFYFYYYFSFLNVKIFWEDNVLVNSTITYCYLGLVMCMKYIQ